MKRIAGLMPVSNNEIQSRCSQGMNIRTAHCSASQCDRNHHTHRVFWQPGLEAMPHAEWVKTQQRLVERENWIMDGDLGHYDAVEVRLPAADTIILLDFSLVRCAWRAFRRGREGSDFWKWLIAYRRRSLPSRSARPHHRSQRTPSEAASC